jgi:hypothetical protein
MQKNAEPFKRHQHQQMIAEIDGFDLPGSVVVRLPGLCCSRSTATR